MATVPSAREAALQRIEKDLGAGQCVVLSHGFRLPLDDDIDRGIPALDGQGWLDAGNVWVVDVADLVAALSSQWAATDSLAPRAVWIDSATEGVRSVAGWEAELTKGGATVWRVAESARLAKCPAG